MALHYSTFLVACLEYDNICTSIALIFTEVICRGQEFEGSASEDEDRPLRCYKGALGGRIETTCEPGVKHCTIQITSE